MIRIPVWAMDLGTMVNIIGFSGLMLWGTYAPDNFTRTVSTLTVLLYVGTVSIAERKRLLNAQVNT